MSVRSRTERWTRDGRTAAIDVDTRHDGLEVVVVAYDLFQQMLLDLGYAPSSPERETHEREAGK